MGAGCSLLPQGCGRRNLIRHRPVRYVWPKMKMESQFCVWWSRSIKDSAFRLSHRKISEELSCQASLEVAWSVQAISAAPIIALHQRFPIFPRICPSRTCKKGFLDGNFLSFHDAELTLAIQ